MNDIRPFCGWRYNPERVDLAQVVAPPYDVVSQKEQEAFLQKSPYNVFHLELGRVRETDTSEENRYTRAQRLWQTWQKQGILIKDPQPALYLYNLKFSWQNKPLVRRGLIALVRLAPWETRRIRPHEKTFDRVTQDRLRLLKATKAQFSQIFCLYHDLSLETLTIPAQKGQKLYEITDDVGFSHQLYKVTHPEVIQEVRRFFDQPLYIADGHHRYTTALSYMREMEQKYGSDPKRCFHYVMMYLCPFEEPGLLVLPTHRVLKLGLPLAKIKELLAPWGSFEEMRDFSLAHLHNLLNEIQVGEIILVNQGKYQRFKLHPSGLEQLTKTLPTPLQKLPVALFTGLLQQVFGQDEAQLKEGGRLFYTPWIKDIAQKAQGDWVGFLLPSTPVKALEEVADAGLVMPHKSTFFFPKILTGTVFFELRPDMVPPC